MKAREAANLSTEALRHASAEADRHKKAKTALKVELRKYEVFLAAIRVAILEAALDKKRFVDISPRSAKFLKLNSKIIELKSELSDEAPFVPPAFAPYITALDFGVIDAVKYNDLISTALAALDQRLATVIENSSGQLSPDVVDLHFDLYYATSDRKTYPSSTYLRSLNLGIQSKDWLIKKILDEREGLERHREMTEKMSSSKLALVWDMVIKSNPYSTIPNTEVEKLGQRLCEATEWQIDFTVDPSPDPLHHPRILSELESGELGDALRTVLQEIELDAKKGKVRAVFNCLDVWPTSDSRSDTSLVLQLTAMVLEHFGYRILSEKFERTKHGNSLLPSHIYSYPLEIEWA